MLRAITMAACAYQIPRDGFFHALILLQPALLSIPVDCHSGGFIVKGHSAYITTFTEQSAHCHHCIINRHVFRLQQARHDGLYISLVVI